MLTERAAASGDRLGIDLTWWEAPGEAVPIDVSDAAVEAWIAKEREALLASSVVGKSLRAGTLGAAAFEARSGREWPEHQEKVETYLTAARVHARELWKSHLVNAELGKLDLAIVNLTEHNFGNVDVVMEFEGDVWSAFDPLDIDTSEFPPRPEPWAKREKRFSPISDALLATPRFKIPRFDTPRPVLQKPRGHSTNTGSTTLRFASVDVRPAYRHHIGPVFVMASAEYAGQEIEGTWHATSSTASGVARGVFTVHVASVER